VLTVPPSLSLQLIHHTGLNGGTNAKELEATLGLKLEHPNIVRTYEFATRSSGSVRLRLSFKAALGWLHAACA
jgi:hypothetical protein